MRRCVLPWLSFVLAAGVPYLLLTLATGGDWLYDWGGTDNWSYVRFFRHWGDPILAQELIWDYKASRLPWIVPGAALYHLLGPMLGAPALHTATLLLVLGAIWSLCRHHLGAIPAALTTATIAAMSGYHGNGGQTLWSYHAAAIVVWELWGLYALSRAAEARARRPWLVLAGMLLMACLLMTTLTAALLPVVGLHYLATSWTRLRAHSFTVLTDAPFLLAGALLTMGGFGWLSLWAGGPFLFW
jgi:hypothetical protein